MVHVPKYYIAWVTHFITKGTRDFVTYVAINPQSKKLICQTTSGAYIEFDEESLTEVKNEQN